MERIRYAVVGLGHIAQTAVIPAFVNAANSQLAAIVSSDSEKRRHIAGRYGIRLACSYDDYEKCLESGEVDAVYIALPNHLHRDYAVRAAKAGIHVLCEKPMAVTEEDCRAMIAAAENAKVKLMVAYRLHFEPANLEAVRLALSGELGEARYFDSVIAQQVKKGDVRLS